MEFEAKISKVQTPQDILRLLGDPGKYSWVIVFLCCISNIPVPFNHMVMAVWGATPPHRCRLPDGVAPTNLSIPEKDGKLDSCSVYVNYSYSSGETRPCPHGWEYTLVGRESTVVTEVGVSCVPVIII